MLLMTFALIMPELVPNTNQGWGDKVQVAITSFSLNPHIKKKSAAFDIFDDAVQIDSCISANLLGTRIFSNPWANMDVVHFCSVSGCQSCVKKKQEHNWVAKSISCLFLKTLFSFPRRNEGQLRVIQTCTLMVFSTIFSEMSQLKLTCQKKTVDRIIACDSGWAFLTQIEFWKPCIDRCEPHSTLVCTAT